MNIKQLQAITTGVAAAVRKFVAQATEPLDGRVKKLEQRLNELEDRYERGTDAPVQKSFAGIARHEANAVYPADSVVVHDGSIWVAQFTTRAVPGDSQAWTRLGTQGVAQ